MTKIDQKSKRIGAVWLSLALVLSACTRVSPPTPSGPISGPTPGGSIGGVLSTQPPPRPTAAPPPAIATALPKLVLPFQPVANDASAPRIIAASPELGERVEPDAEIRFTFDRAMNQTSVLAALVTQPKTEGALTWSDARTAVFKPTTPLQRGATIDVGIQQSAQDTSGATLREPFQIRVVAQGGLEVLQTIPSKDAKDVLPDTLITVMFNRPVVALATLSGRTPDDGKQTVSFDPLIDGAYEWLNTSVLVIRPKAPLPGGTVYTGRVLAGTKDTDGVPMAGDYVWTFSTDAPTVITVSPQPATTSGSSPGRGLARVDTPVVLSFNQNIDTATAQSSFTLLDAKGGAVAGSFAVVSNTLTFTPGARLAYDTQYSIQLQPGVKSISGGVGGTTGFRSTFTTYPLPKITSTTPATGARDVQPYNGFQIAFNAPIDPDTVMPHVTFSPAVSVTRMYTYFDASTNSFFINYPAEPATDYVVTIAPGIRDGLGNTVGDPTTVKFRTGNLPPNARLSIPGNVVLFNANNPARAVALSNNVNSIDLELYKFDITTTDGNLYGSPDKAPPGNRVRSWRVNVAGGDLNKQKRTVITFAEGEGRLAPGLYQLRLTSSDFPANEKPYRTQTVTLIVSDLNLVLKGEPAGALIWATDLTTGEPINGLAIKVYATRYDGGAPVLVDLGAGSTDATGVATVGYKRPLNAGNLFAVSQGRFALVNEAFGGGTPFPVFRGGVARPVIQGRGGATETSLTQDGLRGFIYTDRGIYRPGQKVFVKSWLRTEDDVKFGLASGAASIQISNARGESILNKQVTLDSLGGADTELDLPASAPLGNYRVSLVMPGGPAVADTGFQVAAYRPPEYEVTVTPNLSQTVRGSSLDVTSSAQYLSGGGLGNVPVSWNVVASRAGFNPPQLDKFTFEDNESPWGYIRFGGPFPGGAQTNRPIATGTGTTDGAGKFYFTVPVSSELRLPGTDPTNSGRDPVYSGTVQFSVESSVSGADNQSISGRAQVTVHPAAYYVGVAVPSPIIQAGTVATAELVAVNWDGRRQSGRQLEIAIVRREWVSTYDEASNRWSSAAKDELISTVTPTTNERGEATATFVPATSGSYRVVARIKDESGKIQQSSRTIWVSGPDYVPWFRAAENTINLISDKTSYAPGETAQILIPSPFAGAHYALVTIERGHILKHEVIKLTTNSFVYNLQIGPEHAPNVFVSVALFKGADGTAPPAAQLGTLELEVAPVAQKLAVTLVPSAKLVQPGQTVTYTLTVLDSAGAPVQGSFALDLVDKGILNLRPRSTNAILTGFYGRRESQVQTANLLNMLARVVEDVGGLGGGPAEAQDAAVLTTRSAGAAPPIAPAAAAPSGVARAKNGVDAGSQADEPALRENFADTGFWSPTLNTDAAGKAIVQLKLPDNLTTWVLRAVGLDAATRVGEGLVDVQVSKPLLIRPVTPRFLVVGDVVELSAIVNNNTDSTQVTDVSLKQSSGLSLTSPVTTSVNVAANGEALAKWTALVLDAPQVDVIFEVRGAAGSDASRPRLSTAPGGGIKVSKYSSQETVGTAGVLDGSGSRTELVVLPPNMDATQGTLSVRLEPSLVASIQSGLNYLDAYPYRSAESVMSSFLANVLSFALLREFGQADSGLESQLRASTSDALSLLYSLQNSDGGWGWYKERVSNPHTTLYVLFGMQRAKNAGFEVRPDVIQRALNYAQSSLRNTADLRQTFELNQQAYALMVLAEGGKPDNKRTGELYEKRDLLGVHGKALLALSLGRASKTDARIKTLLADINGRVVQSATGSHWEESQPDVWAMNSDTRSTALVILAHALYDSTNAISTNAVRWLMTERTAEGHWRSTYETSWVMIALTEWVRATGELKADFDFGATLNDKELAKARATTETIKRGSVTSLPLATLIKDTANKLVVTRGEGPGRLYYTAHLRAFLPVPGVKSVDRGINVQRRYVSASCTDGAKCPSITSAKLGEDVRAELTLIAPSNLSYVQVEDFLPAGAELIDSSLATASQLAAKPGLAPGGAPGGPALSSYRPYYFWWNWYTRSELKDDRIALFAGYLPKGVYSYSYTMRATSAGSFNVIPTHAEEQYFPEVFGRGDGALFTVTR